jgi:hypothetical protein
VNDYLHDMQVSTCLVDAYEDYNCFGEVSFSSCRRFQNGTKSSVYFCVKLKKTATETFEMLTSAYSEECLSRTSLFGWDKRFKDGREPLQDDERKGRPSTCRTEESTEVIQKCLAEDRTLSVRMLCYLHTSQNILRATSSGDV